MDEMIKEAEAYFRETQKVYTEEQRSYWSRVLADFATKQVKADRKRIASELSDEFDAGYEAGVAAERERIIAELRVEAAKCEWEVEAGGFMTAIEIVKGGEDGS